MEENHPNAEEVNRWVKKVKELEDQLAKARLEMAKAYYKDLPMPYTEEELIKMIEENREPTLEEFLPELESTLQGQ